MATCHSRFKAQCTIFYLDFVGEADRGPGEKAIEHLKEISKMLKVLGTYKPHIG